MLRWRMYVKDTVRCKGLHDGWSLITVGTQLICVNLIWHLTWPPSPHICFFNYLCPFQKGYEILCPGTWWICGNYLLRNELQHKLPFKGRCWGFFFLLILTTHLWNTCIPVVILVLHEAEQLLAEPRPPGRPLLSWQESPDWEIRGTHFIPAEDRIMSWWFTVRPRLYDRYHSKWETWDLPLSGTRTGSQEVNYKPMLFHQLVRLCVSNPMQVEVRSLTRGNQGKLA